MSSTLEKEVEEYYKFKESYTELLHRPAPDHTDQVQTKNNKPVVRKPRKEGFLSQGAPEYAAKAHSKIDIAAIVAMSKASDEEPKNEKLKGGSKGKK